MIKHILKIGPGPGSRIVLIEPDDIYPLIRELYSGALKKANKGGSDPIISLHPQSQWKNEFLDGSETRWFLDETVECIQSLACYHDHLHCYFPLVLDIEKTISQRRIDIRMNRGLKVYSENQISNAVSNLNELPLDKCFGNDKCAIVVGSDDSLEDHISLIENNLGSLFVVADFKICNTLYKFGIKPDVVVFNDHLAQPEISRQTCALWADIPLIHTYFAAPLIVQAWRGPTFFIGPALPWNRIEDCDRPLLKLMLAGPKVTNTAACICSYLGFTEILLCGVDFHENPQHGIDSETRLRLLPCFSEARLVSYGGDDIATTTINWHSAGKMEELATLADKSHQKIFNLNSNAAKCAAIPWVSHADLSLPASKPDVNNLFQSQDPASGQNHLGEIKLAFSTSFNTYRIIQKYCREALRVIQGTYKKKSVSNIDRCSKQLNKLEKRLTDDERLFVASVVHSSGFETPMLIGIDQDILNPQQLRSANAYYTVLDRLIKGQFKKLEIVRNQILACENQHSAVKSTIDRSTADNDNDAGASDQTELIRPHRSLTSPSSLVHVKATPRDRDVNQWIKVLSHLFYSKNIDQLNLLYLELVQTDWLYPALRCFSTGLVSELEGDADVALIHYQAAIDRCSELLESSEFSLHELSKLIEEALLRLTRINIELDRSEDAMATLGMLYEMIPQYAPSYSKLLHICSGATVACQILKNHMANFPGDDLSRDMLSELSSQLEPSEEDSINYQTTIRDALAAIMGNTSLNREQFGHDQI